jgi:hypothetical protein
MLSTVNLAMASFYLVKVGHVAVPILWIIGALLIIWGAVDLYHRKMMRGIILIVIGVVCGGLNMLGVFS